MTHEERIQSIADIFEFGFPIPLAIKCAQDAFENETGDDLNETIMTLLQTAVKEGAKQGKESMRRNAMDVIKYLD